jgi:hypothetical protein
MPILKLSVLLQKRQQMGQRIPERPLTRQLKIV